MDREVLILYGLFMNIIALKWFKMIFFITSKEGKKLSWFKLNFIFFDPQMAPIFRQDKNLLGASESEPELVSSWTIEHFYNKLRIKAEMTSCFYLFIS